MPPPVGTTAESIGMPGALAGTLKCATLETRTLSVLVTPFIICWPIKSVEKDTESLSISGTIATKLFPTRSSNTASRVSIDSKSSNCVTGDREISIIFPRTSTTAGSKEGAVDGTLLGGSLCVTLGGEEGTFVGK